MFGKLLKREFRSIGRIWWILASVSAGVSLIALPFIRVLTDSRTFDRFTDASGNADIIDFMLSLIVIMAIPVLYLCFFTLCATVTALMVILAIRFYKNNFSDEGYLTFTLPATRNQILLAKVLNSIIWISLHVVLLVVLALTVGVIGPSPAEGHLINTVVLQFIGSAFKAMFNGIGLMLIPDILAVIVALISFGAAAMMLIYFSITVASVAVRKLKLLAAVGIYYGLNSVVTLFLQMSYMFITPMLTSTVTIIPELTKFGTGLLILIGILFVTAALLTFSSFLYMLTLRQLEKRLNLQ